MLDHVGVADVFEDGQVNDVWQEQIVKFAHDLEEYIQRQIAAADQRKVNVRAALMVAFGAEPYNIAFSTGG